MDLQALFDIYKQARKQNAGNLTIGQMLNKLNEFEGNEKVVFSNEEFFDGTWDSYRGYYEDMYLGSSRSDEGLNTVNELRKTLLNALDRGSMQGYKGGDFSVNNDTLVWFSTYGSTGDMIVDVVKINGQIVVITKEDEF